MMFDSFSISKLMEMLIYYGVDGVESCMCCWWFADADGVRLR